MAPPLSMNPGQDSFMNVPPSSFQQNSASYQYPEPQFQSSPIPPEYEQASYEYPPPMQPQEIRQSYNQSPQMNTQMKNAPVGNSFFTNPVSEAEDRRRKQFEDYKAHAQYEMSTRPRRQEESFQESYVPSQKNRPNSRSQIPMMQVTEQQQYETDKKKQYQMELQRQIQDREMDKKRKQAEEKSADYFPFGKPGAGAPFRDASGNIIAARPPKYNENDPKFLNPVEFYNKLGAVDPTQRSSLQYSNSKPQISHDPLYYQDPRNYQDPRGYQDPYAQPGYSQYPDPSYPPRYPPQSYSPQNSQPPNYPLDYPGQSFQQVPAPPMYPPPNREPIPQSHPIMPTGVIESQVEYEKLANKGKKLELGRALQEQMDERRRKKEE